jgi:hypothetical protein
MPSKSKPKETFFMDLMDTRPAKSTSNPYGLTQSVARKAIAARSPGEAIRKFSNTLDKNKFNLNEMRDGKYSRYSLTAMPKSKNPQHSKWYE